MALTLGRLVEDGARSSTARVHYAFLLVGSLTTGLLLFLVGAVGRGLGPVDAAVVDAASITAGLVLIGWAVRVATGRGLSYPKPRWQVPETWRYELPARFTMGAYGYMLGLGVTTNPVLPTIWVVCALTVLGSSLPVALLPWIAYALVRVVTTVRATRSAVCAREAAPGADPDEAMNSPRLLQATRVAVVVLLVTLAARAFSGV